MSNVVIKAENISKQYRLGLVGTGTIKDDLKRWWYSLRGKEDPFLTIGEANDRSVKGDSDYVWSLRDINFEIEEGDTVGIIGKNGAGKSTLLKILSQVTQPTTGNIYTKGRIASLLEVGTGFHPEMTGKENVYMNGAILGMRKKEIDKKFDEIIEFSGVERYIDTPVKRYSSGMYVRLAFSVAAHLESEILIVDEVLAVGDAEFQKKCLGKIGDVSKGQGRTVLFVSHNIAAIKNLCSKGIVLKNGRLDFQSNDIIRAISHYNTNNEAETNLSLKLRNDRVGSGEIKVTNIVFYDIYNNVVKQAISGEFIRAEIFYDVFEPVRFVDVGISFWSSHLDCKIAIWSSYTNKIYNDLHTSGSFNITFEKFPLSNGAYDINLFLKKSDGKAIDWIKKAFTLEVEDGDFFKSGKTIVDKLQTVLIEHNWH